MLWVDEHAPVSPAGLVGNSVQATRLVKLLEAWARRHSGTPPRILLSGPAGVGKTTSIAIAAKMVGFELVEFNSSMQRTHATLARDMEGYARLEGGLTPRPLVTEDDARPALLSVEEADGLDRGGMQYLLSFIKRSSVPVVFTCNLEPRDPKMRTLASHCTDTITYVKPPRQEVITVLLSILDARLGRTLTASERVLSERAVDECEGDPRSAIMRLQILCAAPGMADPRQACEDECAARLPNLFECGRAVFRGQLSIDQASAEIAGDSFLHCATIWSNYPAQCDHDDIDKLSRASDTMSLSDTLEGAYHGVMDAQRIIMGPLTAAYHVRRRDPVPCEFPSLLAHLSSASKATRALRGVARIMRMVRGEALGVCSERDLTGPMAKTLCLCVGRLLRDNDIEAARDVLINYGLDVDDLETLRTNATWHDPLTGGQLRPSLPEERLKELRRLTKDLHHVRTTFCETISLDNEQQADELVEEEVQVAVVVQPPDAKRRKSAPVVRTGKGK